MNFRYFRKLELPSHNDKRFEDFLLRGIDFETGKLIEVEDEKRPESKDRIEYYINMAYEKYFYGFYGSALRYFALALNVDKKQVDAWVGQIRVMVDIGKFEEAIFWADEGLKHFPGSVMMEFAKAFALTYIGKIEEAKRIVNKPIKKNEPSVLWFYRGEIIINIRLNFLQKIFKPYKGIGKIGAFFCFIKALESNPKDAFLNQRIGITYLFADEIPRAYEHLKISLIAAPQNPLTLYCLAECYRKMRNYEYALYYTKKAISYNPEFDAAIELMLWLNSFHVRFIRKLRGLI
jgi:tetratricopeptide (TPR) repeat protein